MRPKIALFNAVAPLANKTPGARRLAAPQCRPARGKSSQDEGLHPSDLVSSPRPQMNVLETRRPVPSASRKAMPDLAYFARHQISAG